MLCWSQLTALALQGGFRGFISHNSLPLGSSFSQKTGRPTAHLKAQRLCTFGIVGFLVLDPIWGTTSVQSIQLEFVICTEKFQTQHLQTLASLGLTNLYTLLPGSEPRACMRLVTSINMGSLTGALSNLLKEPLFTNQRSLTFNARMGPPNPLPRGSLLSGRLSSASSDPSLSASSWFFWTSLREKRVLDGKTSFQRLGCFKGFRGCSFQCTEKRSNEEFRKHSPAVGLTVLQAKWQS